MKESDYINVTNLAHLRTIKQLLFEVILSEPITEEERKEAYIAVEKMTNKVQKAVSKVIR